MPDLAIIETEVKCCVCSNLILSKVRFQWGAVPYDSYRIGSEIRWLRRRDGSIAPPFSIFFFGAEYVWNCGEYGPPRVIILDYDIYDPGEEFLCGKCHSPLGGVVISVSDNIICEVEAKTLEQVKVLLGGAYGKASILTQDQGHWRPRVDWFDHPMVSACEEQGEFVR